MKILITGGAGFIGSHAAEYYAKRGHNVIVLDNLMRSRLFNYNKKSVEYNWDYLKKYKNIHLIRGDIRNEEDIKRAMNENPNVIIHAAAQAGVPTSIKKPKEDFSINACGTLNVLEYMRKKCRNATFIYCSTNKVYGENIDKIEIIEEKTGYCYKQLEGIAENMLIDNTGHTPYGASKYVGDLYAQEYAKLYGIRTGIFRMSCIYGTRQFGFEDQGWVAWFVIANTLNKKITIYGNGKQVRDLLYIDDLINAFDAFVNSNIKYEIFNIGGGKNNAISLLEFLALLERKTKKKPKVRYVDWRPSDQKVYVSDISKIKEVLGWQPRINIREGIEKVIEWITENERLFI